MLYPQGNTENGFNCHPIPQFFYNMANQRLSYQQYTGYSSGMRYTMINVIPILYQAVDVTNKCQCGLPYDNFPPVIQGIVGLRYVKCNRVTYQGEIVFSYPICRYHLCDICFHGISLSSGWKSERLSLRIDFMNIHRGEYRIHKPYTI